MDIEAFKIKEISNQQNIEVLEKKLLDLPQIECPVIHSFGPGVYLREVHLPKGATVIGHHHNFEHMNLFLKGKMIFYSEDGPIELKAPMTLTGKPGRKTAYILEDSVWINIYPTNERDVQKLEAYFLTKSETFEKAVKGPNQLELLTNSLDIKDFSRAMKEYGWTEEKVKEISENTDDLIELPYGSYKIKTGKSNIHDTGLFATAGIEIGETIAPARISGKRTIAGRYTNHSLSPNAKMVRAKNDDINLMATRKISGCLGGQDGEEITIDYREALDLTLETMGAKCLL